MEYSPNLLKGRPVHLHIHHCLLGSKQPPPQYSMQTSQPADRAVSRGSPSAAVPPSGLLLAIKSQPATPQNSLQVTPPASAALPQAQAHTHRRHVSLRQPLPQQRLAESFFTFVSAPPAEGAPAMSRAGACAERQFPRLNSILPAPLMQTTDVPLIPRQAVHFKTCQYLSYTYKQYLYIPAEGAPAMSRAGPSAALPQAHTRSMPGSLNTVRPPLMLATAA